MVDQHEKYNAVTKSMQSAVMLLFLNSIGRHIAKKLLRLKKQLINDDSDSDSDSDSDFEGTGKGTLHSIQLCTHGSYYVLMIYFHFLNDKDLRFTC